MARLPDVMMQSRDGAVSRGRPVSAAVPGLAGLWACGARVRRRMVRLVWMEACIRFALSLLAALVVGLLADWFFDWPRWGRILAWVGYAGVGGWALWRHGIVPWRRIPAGDQLALYMERREPELRSRLISAVQLGRLGTKAEGTGPETEAYVHRLVVETERVASEMDVARLVPIAGLKRSIKRFVPILLVAVGGLWLGGARSEILLRRALGEDVSLPRETRILEVTGGRVLGRGDDLVISARVEGVIPKEGQLILRHASGRVQRMAMESVETRSGTFQRQLANLTSDFRYRVRIHDAESEEFAVEVLPRPVVTQLELTLEFPKYTALAPRNVAPGELTLLRGSRLRLEGTASQPLDQATVRLDGLETNRLATVGTTRRDRFRVDLPVDDPGWTGFSVQLLDARGISSLDPAVYAVSVVEDQAPTVRVVLPARREELVTARGSVLISFEAKDDFGLARLRLMHQAAASTNAAVEPTAIELDLAGEATNVVRRRFEWKLADVRPAVQDGAFLEFWIEAMDRRDQGGPGVGRSERYLARVVSEAEKRSDLLTRAGDAIGRLGDVAQGQERLNDSLGRIILEKASPR